MKRLFFGFAILLTLQVNAQNYLINFTGTGAASTVSEVKVENLTAGTALSVNRGEILRLIGTAGLVSIDNKQYTIRIYPNPMTKDNTVLQIYPPDPGNALITVFDLTGKIEAQYLSYLGSYPQEFRLSGLKNGLHLINVTGKTYHFSSRLVCTGEAEGTINIEKISGYSPDDEKTSTSYSKRDETIINMVYSTGDRLKFTGSSNIYSTVKVDIPESDKTITFNFIPCTDGDNNNYPVVEIGSQIWMAENLKTTKYNDGSSLEYPGINTNDWSNNISGAYAWYNNDKAKYENTYGALYNWYAVNTDNLCPLGWHVPDSQDWITLRDYLGGMNIAGGKIKETGILHWAPTNKYSTNESGFTALPGGFRTTQSFSDLKQFGYMWSSGSQLNSAGASSWYINSFSEVLTESDIPYLNEGLSVRCILGESVISIPTVLTDKIINISANTATCGGTIDIYERAHITALGVCWSISGNPTIDNDKTSDFSVDGTFTSNLSGLVPGTTYHVRAYATNRKGTAYGEDLTFTVLPVIPTLSTIAASDIKSTIATAGGNISSNGGAVVTVSGICWDTSQNPSIAGSHTSDGTAIGSFTSGIKNLIPSTIYYVRAYAANSEGTAYGNEISFTTGPLQIASVTTATISSITSTTALSGGNIVDDGGKTVTSRGICWATTSAPTTGDNKFTNGAGTGSFTGNISGLQPGTIYHVRAYAINSEGTAYGNDLTFTSAAILPTISTKAVTGITRTTATSGGNITSNGGGSITASGISWSTAHNPTITGSHTTDGTVSGIFASSMTGLIPNTLYYVRAYATNSAGTAYGNEISFTTNPVQIATLTTVAVSSITSSTASSGGNITNDGDGTITVRGICWAITPSPTINDNLTLNGTGTGTFTSDLSGLQPVTTYHVRAYATNSAGTAYGNEVSFTTNPILIATLSTTTVSVITRTTATSGGNITSNGGAAITASGICWNTSHNPSIAGSHSTDGTATGNYVSNATGLIPNTLYYIRAYATNSAGTAYGNEVSFTTNPIVFATLTTTTVSSITSVTAASGGNITDDGDGTITARGICWAPIPAPTISDNKTSDGTGKGTYTSNITGLQPVTTYYVRAYATNSAGTAYGNEISFTTNPIQIASLTTIAVSSLTSATASSGGNITDDGGGTVTARGICWAVTPVPSISDNITLNGTGPGTYTSNITGLQPVTTYHVRAYATNSEGTAYGNVVTFTTPAALPNLTTTAISGITRTTATSGGNISSNGGATVTTSGICWGTSHNPSIAGSNTADGTPIGNFASNMTGLTPGTLYYIRAYATNISGTAYGNEVSFTTNPILLATLTTTAVSSITSTTASSGGNITDDGGGTITVRGTCWATTSAPTISNSKSSNGTGTGSFTSSISGLQPGTTYHVRAYATNSAGTAYGNDLTFTTDAVIPTITTTAATGITRTNATSGGNITSDGGATVTTSGICWNTSHNPSIAGSHSQDGTATGNFASNATGLTPNTLYYIRAYATNSIGTAYGNEVSFTTNPIVIATITTTAISSVTSTTASSGGNISDDGGVPVTARGICWANTSTPTIGNDITTDGTGTGSFVSSMTGLHAGTTYYLRAYAINSRGTAYGAQISFTTDPLPNTDVTFHVSANGSKLLHSVGDKSIIFITVGQDNYLRYSSNNGVSYNQGVKVTNIFTSDNKARILENGNIVLFCGNKIYYSDNNMTTITPCNLLNKDGSGYTLHNPVNTAYPGAYFHFMGGFVENDGVAVLGNYANNSMGASPVNLYYSLDGITWKVFYTFGQNNDYTDNGTAMGGVGGTLLGDPNNPLKSRHIHSVNIGEDGNFYACTGDGDGEIHFLKCSYNKIADTWSTNDLLTSVSSTWQRMRALGVFERNGYLYWGSDGPGTFIYNGVQYDCFGFYKCAIPDINDPSKHILLQSLPDACYSFLNTGHIVFAGLQSFGFVYISYDYGETWFSYAKPAWMHGGVSGVWYNQLYKYLVTSEGVYIESNLF